MKNLLQTLIPFIALCLGACNNKVGSYGMYSVYKKSDDSSIYILTIDSDKRSYSFRSDIKLDLKTLKSYNEFLVDKNGAYGKYEISDDCKIIPIEEVDIATFQVLDNSIYAKDKNHVYDSRNGIISNADVESFEVLKNGQGKDKNRTY